MAIFDGIEDIFKKVSEFNDYSRALVTLTTAFGALVILVITLKIAYDLIQVFRLYVFHQYCCQKDLVKKYGKWAVISGSTDGIGQAMAKELAERGMSILVIGRNDEKLANTKAMLERVPNVGEVETVKIDLSDPSLENFDRIREKIDPDNRDIGILINNAGIFTNKFMRFNRYEMGQVVTIVNLNITATLHLTRMIMPGMIQRNKGLVMNVSSTLGAIPALYMGAYGPTKSFIDSFTRQLQMEYSAHPIDIVLLTPGPVYTKLMVATTKLNSSMAIPTAEEFARSTISALSAGINIYSGTMLHGFFRVSGIINDKLGLLPFGFRMNLRLNAVDYELSPVPKRRQLAKPPSPASGQTNGGDTQENVSLSGVRVGSRDTTA